MCAVMLTTLYKRSRNAIVLHSHPTIQTYMTTTERRRVIAGPMIALSMGDRGVITRILAAKYGGFLTFGALSSGQESAPGQPTVADLRQLYQLPRVSQATKVFGIIGNPVKHSRSPVLHNKAMQQEGFDGVYVPLLVDDMDRFVDTFAEQDWAGFSVTIPHKVCCARLAAAATAVPALATSPSFDHNVFWSSCHVLSWATRVIVATAASTHRCGATSFLFHVGAVFMRLLLPARSLRLRNASVAPIAVVLECVYRSRRVA